MSEGLPEKSSEDPCPVDRETRGGRGVEVKKVRKAELWKEEGRNCGSGGILIKRGKPVTL